MKDRKSKATRGAKQEGRGGATTANNDVGGGDSGLLDRHPQIVALVLIALFAALLHSRLLPLVADSDSFYHARHAWVYRTYGLFDSSFPWAQYSAVRTNAADLWYGLHLLMIPLSFFDPLLNGIYCGAFLVTVASLWLVYATFRMLELRWPLLWLFFVPLMSSDLMYRLTMLRPHPLSLGLVLLLFAHLVRKRSRSTLPGIFLIGAMLAWLHLALIWLPIFVGGAVTLVRLLHRRLPDLASLAALSIGLVAGVLLRPNPLGGLNLVYIQIVKLMATKQADLGMPIGVELLPFYLINFYDQFIPLTILLVLALGAFFVLLRDRSTPIAVDTRIAMWASLLVAITFFVMTFEVARRAHEICVGFGTIFIALVATRWRWTATQPAAAKLAIGVATMTLMAAPIWGLYRYDQIAAGSSDPRRYQTAGDWLAQHAKPGEIVFHPRWERFGDLFLWNPRNYYINGMDPIFEYAYDPSLYWKNHYLYNGAADEVTCAAYPCVDEVITTYATLKLDFRASYIIVEPALNPGLDQYLSRTPQYAKVFESTTGVVLYKID